MPTDEELIRKYGFKPTPELLKGLQEGEKTLAEEGEIKGERVRWNKREKEAIKEEEKRIRREKTLAFTHVSAPPEKEIPAIQENKSPEKVPSALKASTENVIKISDAVEPPRESKASYEGTDFIDYYLIQRKNHWGKIEMPVLLELYEKRGIQKNEKNLKIIKEMLFSSMEYAPDTDPNDFLNTVEQLASDRGKLGEFIKELKDEIDFLIPLTEFKSDVAYTWVRNFKLLIDSEVKILDARLKSQLQACLDAVEDYLISPTTILEEVNENG